MTTIDTREDAARSVADATTDDPTSMSFFENVAAWVVTSDHKRIGRLYVCFGLLALFGSAVLGSLLGVERADDASNVLRGNALLQLFQSYRVALVFGTIIPLGLGLSIAVVPLQLGARSIAFPRVALTGFYAWLGGFALTFIALGRNGGFGGGDEQMVALFLAAQGLMIVGVLASAGSVATSILTTRAPGLTMGRLPLFAWSALVGAIGILIALPVVFGAIIYLYLDLRYAQLNFGGSTGLAPWIAWAFSVPAVAVYAIPAVGVSAELVPVAFGSRPKMRGATYTGIALVGVAALAATTQQFVHDITFDTDGQSTFEGLLPWLVFAGLPLLGVLIVMMAGAATMRGKAKGTPNIGGAFVFSFLGVDLVAAGLFANAFRGVTDLELLGTSLEEGATLLIVYGSALTIMGGVVFWAPKLWGRTMPEKQIIPLAFLGVVGAALAGLSMCIAGVLGQSGGVPATDADVASMLSLGYDSSGQLWNILAMVGHILVALTVVGFVVSMLFAFTGSDDDDDEEAEINPFGGQTIEWTTSSPAPADNFEHVPTVSSAEPVLEMMYEGSQS